MGQEQSASAINNAGVKPAHVKQRANLKDIVVVSSKLPENQNELLDEDIANIEAITLSRPILQNLSGELDYSKIPRLNSGPLTEMILRYQFHLTECAEAVSFDQNVLSKRIKELDSLASKVNKNLNEHQKNIDHAINQLQKVTEVSTMLKRIEINLKQTKQLFVVLNEQLPTRDQIKDPEYQNIDRQSTIN
ncbi:BLOC-1-related complex subunit 5-like [Hydractinia symbiolongicarpus]|uniref:BLOC-1-related complex subunit 5-like n=1 Tax=Hydractinia symbiolongicarpus TaxID=13093 RepID=UPI00254A15F4|nr:BLOC-1-related complex subunit 5-like [Hydractinia symbiolongicarpus]XP_057314770.1 BLOC-1-related complex subunit 5-like [Hydractinia symbiolongicarpus]